VATIPRFLLCVAASQRAAQLSRYREPGFVGKAIDELTRGLIAIPLSGRLAESVPEPAEGSVPEAVSEVLFSATCEIDASSDGRVNVGAECAIKVGFAVEDMPTDPASVAALNEEIPLVVVAKAIPHVDWVNDGMAKILCSLKHDPTRIRWIQLPFRPSMAGRTTVVIDCYARRQWIATFDVHFESVGARGAQQIAEYGGSGAATPVPVRSGW
jgi:hypothetical protein